MAVKINTATLAGIEGTLATVEVDITRGLPAFTIVGLADLSVKEAKERVRSAIINSGYEFPVNRITINLAPADIRKVGAQFDLPIAIGILLATEQISIQNSKDLLFLGELSLCGELKKIRGGLPIVLEATKNNIKDFIIPIENAKECSIVKGANIFPFENLKQVVGYLLHKDLLPYVSDNKAKIADNYDKDFDDVVGQESCKRAMEVAAAGGHNILMFGPPGSGKTMIAQRLPSILPKLSYEEALEVTKVYSISGKLINDEGLVLERPFRSPHHTSSCISLVGGGNSLSPGEITLAHNGVLFLDELLEYKRNVLEVLRQPLEDRTIKISRATGTICYPANFMLIAALNPCPCGFHGSKIKECICTENERRRYIGKLSGPLLDRLDIFIFVNSLNYSELKIKKSGESSRIIRARVEKAREIQRERYHNEKIFCNAELNSKLISKYCKLDRKSNKLIEKVYERMCLSNRSYSRILKLARTIADLDGAENIAENHVIESIQYRKFLGESIV